VELISSELRGPVARVTLSRPESRNSMTQDMWPELVGTVERLAARPAVRALVITGAGGHFCTGADVAEFATVYATAELARRSSAQIEQAVQALGACPKPLVALIRGSCWGGGCSIALACDLRLADDTALFGISPTRLGLAYRLSDCRRLIRAVGQSTATAMLLAQRRLSAREALAAGLVHAVSPAAELEQTLESWLRPLLAGSPAALRDQKSILHAAMTGDELLHRRADQAFHDAFSGPDFAEGYQAFLEKRPPRFPDLQG